MPVGMGNVTDPSLKGIRIWSAIIGLAQVIYCGLYIAVVVLNKFAKDLLPSFFYMYSSKYGEEEQMLICLISNAIVAVAGVILFVGSIQKSLVHLQIWDVVNKFWIIFLVLELLLVINYSSFIGLAIKVVTIFVVAISMWVVNAFMKQLKVIRDTQVNANKF